MQWKERAKSLPNFLPSRDQELIYSCRSLLLVTSDSLFSPTHRQQPVYSCCFMITFWAQKESASRCFADDVRVSVPACVAPACDTQHVTLFLGSRQREREMRLSKNCLYQARETADEDMGL